MKLRDFHYKTFLTKKLIRNRHFTEKMFYNCIFDATPQNYFFIQGFTKRNESNDESAYI